MTDSPTRAIIHDMLTESTGTHMMDSGGAYGRHWQANRARDLANEPRVAMSVRYGYMDVQLSLFHFLTENLTYEPNLQREYENFCEEIGEGCSLGTLEDFCEDFLVGSYEATGPNSDGVPIIVNTYNEPSLLDQTIQFAYVEMDNLRYNGAYIGLSVHGGCDVRGGYTSVKWFKADSDDLSFLLDYCGSSIEVYGEGSDGDLGPSWFCDFGNWESNSVKDNLEDCTWVSLGAFNDQDEDGKGNLLRDDGGCLSEDVIVYCEDTDRAWFCDEGEIFELKVS